MHFGTKNDELCNSSVALHALYINLSISYLGLDDSALRTSRNSKSFSREKTKTED